MQDREPFDRDQDFLVVKPFRFDGKPFEPGDPFDKFLATTRKLRQLYEKFYIRQVPPRATPQTAEPMGSVPRIPPVRTGVARRRLSQKAQGELANSDS